MKIDFLMKNEKSLLIRYFTFHIKTNSIFNDRSLILELTSSLSSRVLSFLHDGQFQRITNKTQRNRVQRTFRLVLLFRSVVSRFSGLSVELSFPSRLGRFLEKLIMKIHASSPENAPQDKSRGQRQWSCVDGRTINPYHWDMTAVNGEETSTDSQIHSNIEASRKIWKEKASIFDRWIVHWRLNHEPAQQKYQVNQSRFLWLRSAYERERELCWTAIIDPWSFSWFYGCPKLLYARWKWLLAGTGQTVIQLASA